MVAAIIAVGIELTLILITRVVPMNAAFAWFVIIMFLLCTIASIITLVTNIQGIRNSWERGKYITGTVFSGIGILFGTIFFISFFAALLGFVQ